MTIAIFLSHHVDVVWVEQYEDLWAQLVMDFNFNDFMLSFGDGDTNIHPITVKELAVFQDTKDQKVFLLFSPAFILSIHAFLSLDIDERQGRWCCGAHDEPRRWSDAGARPVAPHWLRLDFQA